MKNVFVISGGRASGKTCMAFGLTGNDDFIMCSSIKEVNRSLKTMSKKIKFLIVDEVNIRSRKDACLFNEIMNLKITETNNKGKESESREDISLIVITNQSFKELNNEGVMFPNNAKLIETKLIENPTLKEKNED